MVTMCSVLFFPAKKPLWEGSTRESTAGMILHISSLLSVVTLPPTIHVSEAVPQTIIDSSIHDSNCEGTRKRPHSVDITVSDDEFFSTGLVKDTSKSSGKTAASNPTQHVERAIHSSMALLLLKARRLWQFSSKLRAVLANLIVDFKLVLHMLLLVISSTLVCTKALFGGR